MKLSVLVTLSLVSLGSLLAGDLQQLADNLQVKAPTADDKKLTMPRVKEATIRLLGAAFAVWNDEIDRLHIKATAPWIYGSVCRIHQEINTIESCCPLLH